MKKIFLIFVMLTIVSSVVFAGGIDNPKASSKMAIMQKDADHIQLFYKNSKQATIEVSIFDADNKLRFTEVIRKSNGFIRPYNLSSMEKGEYTVVVNDGTDQFIEKISTHVKETTLLSNVISMKKAGSYLLTLADEKAQYFTVTVTDKDNNVLLQRKENVNKQFSKIYTFPEKVEGLKFLVTTNHDLSRLISVK
jgi:hypothetical protein